MRGVQTSAKYTRHHGLYLIFVVFESQHTSLWAMFIKWRIAHHSSLQAASVFYCFVLLCCVCVCVWVLCVLFRSFRALWDFLQLTQCVTLDMIHLSTNRALLCPSIFSIGFRKMLFIRELLLRIWIILIAFELGGKYKYILCIVLC